MFVEFSELCPTRGYGRTGPDERVVVSCADVLSASDAHQLGLINEIVPADRLFEHVSAVAQEIATHAPITLRVTKEAIRRLQVHRRAVDGDDLTVMAHMSEDFREGVTGVCGESASRVFRGK